MFHNVPNFSETVPIRVGEMHVTINVSNVNMYFNFSEEKHFPPSSMSNEATTGSTADSCAPNCDVDNENPRNDDNLANNFFGSNVNESATSSRMRYSSSTSSAVSDSAPQESLSTAGTQGQSEIAAARGMFRYRCVRRNSISSRHRQSQSQAVANLGRTFNSVLRARALYRAPLGNQRSVFASKHLAIANKPNPFDFNRTGL